MDTTDNTPVDAKDEPAVFGGRTSGTWSEEEAKTKARERWDKERARAALWAASGSSNRLKALQDEVWEVLGEINVKRELVKMAKEDHRRFWDIVQRVLPQMGKVEEGGKSEEEVGREAMGKTEEELAKWMEEWRRNKAQKAAGG